MFNHTGRSNFCYFCWSLNNGHSQYLLKKHNNRQKYQIQINCNQLLLSETISVEYAWSITLMDQPITLEHICKKNINNYDYQRTLPPSVRVDICSPLITSAAPRLSEIQIKLRSPLSLSLSLSVFAPRSFQ